MSSVVIKNSKTIIDAINGNVDLIEKASAFGIAQTALSIERQIKLAADTGVHGRKEGHIPGTGPGPNRVTGNLIRSVVTEVAMGFGAYKAVVGPTAEYARALELGNPRWKSGVRYPFVIPTVGRMIGTGQLQRTFNGAFKTMYKGG